MKIWAEVLRVGSIGFNENFSSWAETHCDCIRTLLEVRPKGPYFLGGWTGAGVIAYEMAQQLTRRGENVALVILFETQNQAHWPEV